MFKAFWTISMFSPQCPENDRFPHVESFLQEQWRSENLQLFLAAFRLFVWAKRKKNAKANCLQQSKFENIMLINRKKEKAAKQLPINSIDNNGDGVYYCGHRIVVTGYSEISLSIFNKSSAVYLGFIIIFALLHFN